MNDNNMDAQVMEDFAAFSEPDPKVVAEQRKRDKEREKKEKELERKLRPEQLKAAAKLTDHMKEQQQAELKADLIQRLQDYVKLVKEYHPERAEYLKIPKTFGVKNSVEELRVYIRDVQTELGKKGGLEFAKTVWCEGFRGLEQVSEFTPLKLEGLGQAAQNAVLPRRLEDGTIVQGPAVPTLAEFCCKHSNWFSTDVDIRMGLMVVRLVAQVHRVNSEADEMAELAKKHVSAETAEKVKNL